MASVTLIWARQRTLLSVTSVDGTTTPSVWASVRVWSRQSLGTPGIVPPVRPVLSAMLLMVSFHLSSFCFIFFMNRFICVWFLLKNRELFWYSFPLEPEDLLLLIWKAVCCDHIFLFSGEESLMFCDICDRGYHTYCVNMSALPRGRWECRLCVICACCGSNVPGPGAWRFQHNDHMKFLQTMCFPCTVWVSLFSYHRTLISHFFLRYITYLGILKPIIVPLKVWLNTVFNWNMFYSYFLQIFWQRLVLSCMFEGVWLWCCWRPHGLLWFLWPLDPHRSDNIDFTVSVTISKLIFKSEIWLFGL